MRGKQGGTCPTPSSPVQHLGGGPFQLLQDLQQLGVIVAQAAPAQHPCQVIASPQGQDTQLALWERDRARVSEQPRGAPTTPLSPLCPSLAAPQGTRGDSQLRWCQHWDSASPRQQRQALSLTCLWRPRASISDSTQPTLPSPPHTRIRKVENFWKRRSLGMNRRRG